MNEVPEQKPAESLAPPVSPLAEADPNAINVLIQERIDELFNKPPLSLSDVDLQAIVEYYRQQRVKFAAEAATKPPRKARAKAPTSVKEAITATVDLL